MPGPDGKWYVIGIYYGCKYCDAPLGLNIDLFDDDDMRSWGAWELPIIGGPERPNFGIPTINPNELTAGIFNALDDAGVNVGEDEDERDAFLDDFDLLEIVGKAMSKAADAFDKERKPIKPKARKR